MEKVTEKERRKRLASLPFSEKLKILEKLRERSRVIAASGLRGKATGQPTHAKTTHGSPPVIIPCRGVPIPAVSREELRRMEDDDE